MNAHEREWPIDVVQNSALQASQGPNRRQRALRSVLPAASNLLGHAAAQFLEGGGLDLADAFASEAEDSADIIEGLRFEAAEAEAHAEDLLLACAEQAEGGIQQALEVLFLKMIAGRAGAF